MFIRQTTYRLTCTFLCTLAITTLGCSQEEPNALEGTRKRVTVTATTPEEGLQTRVNHNYDGYLGWDDYDEIGVWPLNKEKNYATFATKRTGGIAATAQFTGEISCEDNDVLCAVYPPLPLMGDEIHFDVSNQVPEPNRKYIPLYMYATGTLRNNEVDFKFQHVLATIEVDWSAISPNLGPNQLLTLSADGLRTSATLRMTSEKPQLIINGDGVSRQTLQFNVSSFQSALLHLFASDLKNIEIMITDGINTYRATLPDRKVETGKMYATKDVLTFSKLP